MEAKLIYFSEVKEILLNYVVSLLFNHYVMMMLLQVIHLTILWKNNCVAKEITFRVLLYNV